MANLDPLYIVGIELGEYFVDPRTGLPLSGGRIYFFKDLARVVPKPVYRLSGSPPNYEYLALPNYLELSDAGTIIDALGNEVSIYYFPWNADGDIERYYVRVEAADGETIKEFQAWPNNFEGGTTPSGTSSSSENQISNSQFSDVLFNPASGVTYSFSGAVDNEEFEVAPGWNLRVSSNASGSIIVGRNAIEGSLNVPTNPPFILSISPQGNSVSSISLIQKFSNNPDLWANQYIAGSLTVTSLDGINHSFEMQYAPSISIEPTVILSGSSGESGYATLSGTALLPAGVNTEDGDTGYDDIEIILPISGNYALTSVQVFGTDSAATLIPYQQETTNRQKDHTFNYYNPLIQAIPAPSISEGWDFKMNPAQWGSTYASTTAASAYMWDQTIVWQNNNHLISGSRDAAGRLAINVSSASGQFALVQYISIQQMRLLLANGWSTLINAYTDNVSGVSGTVSFYYTTDASLPVMTAGTNQSLISSLDANGKPATFHGNWTELPNPLLGSNRFTIPYNASNTTSSMALNGWSQPAYGVSSTATYVAIVIGFSSVASINIYFDSIAVTPGRLAVPFAPADYLSTLKQMHLYYEKSYPYGVLPGAAESLGGAISLTPIEFASSTGLGFYSAEPSNISINYDEKVSATPSFTMYDYITGTQGYFSIFWYSSGVVVYDGSFLYTDHYNTPLTSSSSNLSISKLGVTASTPAVSIDNALQIFNFTIDSRYGLF